MLFFENEWFTATCEALHIALENCSAGFAKTEVEETGSSGKPHARRQPDQVVGTRKVISLVEVVDAPNQPAVAVAPGAEIFEVQISH